MFFFTLTFLASGVLVLEAGKASWWAGLPDVWF
jgi:hypothetical protein